jgi:hypothetical protein
MCQKMQQLICFVSLFLPLFLAATSQNAYNGQNNCVITGPCIPCRKDELDLEYCKKTARKVKIKCEKSESENDDYDTCLLTAEDDQIRVILFQIAMGVIGGLAFWGVKLRKQTSMTKYDYRKLRY